MNNNNEFKNLLKGVNSKKKKKKNLYLGEGNCNFNLPLT
jgi:hypothetical protein